MTVSREAYELVAEVGSRRGISGRIRVSVGRLPDRNLDSDTLVSIVGVEVVGQGGHAKARLGRLLTRGLIEALHRAEHDAFGAPTAAAADASTHPAPMRTDTPRHVPGDPASSNRFTVPPALSPRELRHGGRR